MDNFLNGMDGKIFLKVRQRFSGRSNDFQGLPKPYKDSFC